MSTEEAIKRWELVKYFCDTCPVHGASAITTHRVLALQNASDIYAMGGLKGEDAINIHRLKSVVLADELCELP